MKNKYEIKEDYVIIIIPHKDDIYECKIDLEDFNKINSFKTTWNLNINRTGHMDGIRTKVQKNKVRKQYWMHRIIMSCPDDKIIDHKNGDVLDNRKSNLRIVDFSINSQNSKRKTNSQTGVRNIYLSKDKYRVRIKRVNIGSYNTLEEAIHVANTYRRIIIPGLIR